jgi:hypothetical protein
LSTFQHSESAIKQKIIHIINTFRGIYLNPTDLKINELKRTTDDYYEISGEYIYKNMFDNSIYEKGLFDIRLDTKNLEIVSSKISPKT